MRTESKQRDRKTNLWVSSYPDKKEWNRFRSHTATKDTHYTTTKLLSLSYYYFEIATVVCNTFKKKKKKTKTNTKNSKTVQDNYHMLQMKIHFVMGLVWKLYSFELNTKQILAKTKKENI